MAVVLEIQLPVRKQKTTMTKIIWKEKITQNIIVCTYFVWSPTQARNVAMDPHWPSKIGQLFKLTVCVVFDNYAGTDRNTFWTRRLQLSNFMFLESCRWVNRPTRRYWISVCFQFRCYIMSFDDVSGNRYIKDAAQMSTINWMSHDVSRWWRATYPWGFWSLLLKWRNKTLT